MLQPTIRNSIINITVIVFLLVVLTGGCNPGDKKKGIDDFSALLPAYVKDSIYLFAANPFSAAKAALGRYFFYDRRMSVNQAKSCSSCHDPAFSFTDGYRRSIGAMGDNVQHNAPALINIVFKKYLTAADSTLHFPEQQISNPMFHNKPVELGWQGNEEVIMLRLKKDSLYQRQMPLLFSGKEPFSLQNVQACISSFIKTIVSFNAPYDRYTYHKDSMALSASQVNGMKLFFSDRLHCSSCHGGINFSTPALVDKDGTDQYYQNTGLYNIDGTGAYPANDRGLMECTKQSRDMGKYRVASLRNLAFTAPYLHDGTAADLGAVIDLYKNGGRNIATGMNQGDGRKNPYKNPLLQGFVLAEQEKKDLIGFLLSLSDSSVCNNPSYSNPFTRDETHP
jgi:cytochrome c peroxidase